MSTHDVIDNRNEKLVDNILTILPEADRGGGFIAFGTYA